MPVSGDKITAPSYNSIRNTFINYLTNGTGDIGYGQTANSVAVSQAQKITQTQWANLALDIQRMAIHQGTSVTLPTITSTTKITANAANQLQTAATTVTSLANRYKLAEYSDEALTSSTRSTAWKTTIQHNFNITFPSADAARYFFNTGSTIRIKPTFTKSGVTPINDDWESLINNLGTVVFGHTSTSATGTAPGNGSLIGFYDLTTSAQPIYFKTGIATAYISNDYTIRAYRNAASTIIYFECSFNDDKVGGGGVWDENVTGTVTNAVRMFRASGSNVVVTGPTAVTTANL